MIEAERAHNFSLHSTPAATFARGLVKKSLSVRTHVCSCGTVLDRDHNAALNILAKALRQVGIEINTVGHTGINAFGQNDLYSLVVTPVSKPTG